jgi:transposase
VGRVVIGMDPHKRSATIEVIDDRKTVLAGGRFGTDRDGYRAMLALGRRHPQRMPAEPRPDPNTETIKLFHPPVQR